MESMFVGAYSFNQPLNTWDVSNVSTMRGMFSLAYSFNQPLNAWDVSSVTTMEGMFASNSVFNRSLDNWVVSSVTDMRDMFLNASSFNQNLSNWDVSGLYYMNGIFDNSGLSIQNYDSILIAWQSNSHRYGVNFGGAGLEYCMGDSARQQLINQSAWQFSGDTKNCTTVGLNESHQNKFNFSIYPIPTEGEVTFEVQSGNINDPLRVYNTNGYLVEEYTLRYGVNKIDLSHFSNGLYLFRWGTKEEKVLLSY